MTPRVLRAGMGVKLLGVLLLIAAGAGTVFAATWYVDANVVGGPHDGTNWPNAYTNLQDALGMAASNDQIWGAQGTC